MASTCENLLACVAACKRNIVIRPFSDSLGGSFWDYDLEPVGKVTLEYVLDVLCHYTLLEKAHTGMSIC